MSEANLLLVKRFYEDRTQADLERFLAFLHPEAEMDFSELDRPYGRVFRGLEEIKVLHREIVDPWQEVSFQTSGALAEGDWVVIDVARTAQSAAGLTVFSSTTAAVRAHAGRFVHLKVFQERADALLAAGISA